MIRRILKWYRMRRAVAKWNAERYLIAAMSVHADDGLFKWNQLVWQEIAIYILLGEQVEPDEFYTLCTRRGLDLMMREYLLVMLRYVGLGKHIPMDTVCTANSPAQETDHNILL